MEPGKPHTAESEALTPLYARWMKDLLGGPIPRETRATCDDCAMCAKSDAPGERAVAADEETFFDPAIKCCSTIPELSDFLVGGILAAGDLDSGSSLGAEGGPRRNLPECIPASRRCTEQNRGS